MNIKLVTFAGTTKEINEKDRHYIIHKVIRDYKKEAERLIASAKKEGIDAVYYGMDWLKETKEYKENPETFKEPPFFWAFKPLLIWYTMKEMKNDDIIIWADSNHVVRKYPTPLINIAIKNGIYTYDHYPTYYPNECWTHKDTFAQMGCDEEKYWRAPQYHANVLVIMKSPNTISFIEEWKNNTCNYDVVGVNKLQNAKCFVDKRDDQSVFSILAIKHNYKAYKKPDEYIVELKELDVRNN